MIRVKLYVLNENRQWDDKGKGYVSVAPKSSLDPVTSSTTTTTSQSTTDDVPEAKIDPKPTSTTEIDDENAPGTSTDSLSAFTVEGIERDKCPGESGSVTSSSSSSKTADVAESGSQPPTAVSGIVASSAVSAATETTGSTSSSSSSSTSGGSNSNSKEMMIIMKSEADPSVILLQSRIQPDTMYQKQQDTLIVWNSETEGDLALSFEEIKGCTTIYDQIWAYQNEVSETGSDDSPLAASDVTETNDVNVSTVSALNESETKCKSITAALSGDLDELLEAGKIEMLRWDFEYQLMNAKYKENVCRVIENEKLIPKMINLFRRCEEEFFMTGLENLYSIFKNLVSMGKTALYDILFSEACLDDVIGILEYPPGKERQRHREFINNATLKEALPIKKEKLLHKIKQTYKVQYIHDVILPTPPIMEEMNLYTLQSFIYLNKAEIVTMIQEDVPFLKSIISQISKEDSSYEEKKNSFGFFKELCAYSQCLDALKREAFFVFIIETGILKAIAHILCIEIDELASKEETEDTVQLQWSAVEVFAYFIEVCPNVVREFILTDHRENMASDETLLINLLLYQMLNDRDNELGGALQVLNLFRIILDFSVDSEDTLVGARHVLDPFNRQLDSKDSFLSMFYSRSVPILITQVLSMTSDPEALSRDDYRSALSAQIVLRLLSYCLSHGHGFHIRNYLIKNELIGRFLLLMKSKHVFLVLTALKFVRTIIGLKDDVFNRHIVANKLIQPVVNAYLHNGHKYNLLNSALIEFFDFIKTENMKLLILHVGENYMSSFQDVTYVTTFQDLKTRYAMLAEFEKHDSASTLGTPIMSTDYSDSENASEKSLQFLSPTIDSAPSGSISRTLRGQDWLAAEDDDDDMGDDAAKQLLGDSESLVEEEKWMQQWDYHTSQLRKKREQKMAGGSDSSTGSGSVFDTKMFLKKASKSGGGSETISATVSKVKIPIKFSSSGSVSPYDKIFDDDVDELCMKAGPIGKQPRTDLDDKKESLPSPDLSPIFAESRCTFPPTNSLVDYDSDSDDEDYAADTEDLENVTKESEDSVKPVANSSPTKEAETKLATEDSPIASNGILPVVSDSADVKDDTSQEPEILVGVDSSPDVKSCRVQIESASLDDPKLTPKRTRDCISKSPAVSPSSQTLSSIKSRLFKNDDDSENDEAQTEIEENPAKPASPDQEAPPKKRTKSLTDSAAVSATVAD
ncbi:serine/threonine-protein phosphatase 4 regulatory subunit 3-like isoform X2 [Convolutriloba macropyga]|uniref:serine/threonine-protein phosphatase 4 regulatory subunit 3-like isoform X2 n=1 Tax=Convolutriloba macropyga TaxID=536237 RepID=UPI003F522B0A